MSWPRAGWRTNGRRSKPSSYHSLEVSWRVYVGPRWAETPIGDIRPSDVEDWVRRISSGHAVTQRTKSRAQAERVKPRSATVVYRAVGVLAGILDGAVKDNRLAKNPARGADNLPRKESSKPRRYLTHQQVHAFAGAVEDPAKGTLILVLAYCGLRWGEAIGLRVRDLNMLRRRINVNRSATEVEGVIRVGTPKNWEQRSVPFPAVLAPAIARLCESKGPDDLVFAEEGGSFFRRPRTTHGAGSWFGRALTSTGLEHLTPHDLRHTAASLAISAGANVKAVQRMLGHKSAAMTLDTYADLFEDDLDAVAEALNERALSANVGTLWGLGTQTGS